MLSFAIYLILPHLKTTLKPLSCVVLNCSLHPFWSIPKYVCIHSFSYFNMLVMVLFLNLLFGLNFAGEVRVYFVCPVVDCGVIR